MLQHEWTTDEQPQGIKGEYREHQYVLFYYALSSFYYMHYLQSVIKTKNILQLKTFKEVLLSDIK